jgi:UPF0042 nucleotide-binding protein
MELLIITGLSGAGKTRAADICEDLSYYCVDNLPVALLPRFAALCDGGRGRYQQVALVMDARSVESQQELVEALEELNDLHCTYHILYLEAGFDTILRRYMESRRPHPLAGSGLTLQEAMEQERAFLAPLRERADRIIDTGGMSLNQLKSEICAFVDPGKRYFTVNLISFGYKNGIPPEADFVFDVRCLPNPYYEADLQYMTGLDEPVSSYVFRSEIAQTFLEKLTELLLLLIPPFQEDRTELNVAIGCTGGHHRSVAVTQALADALEGRGISLTVTHRDMGRGL